MGGIIIEGFLEFIVSILRIPGVLVETAWRKGVTFRTVWDKGNVVREALIGSVVYTILILLVVAVG
ncbi:MAG: hypothetical protein JNM62_04950 [Flavobacteriales bacterium]|nr:hypothetical protein [Flavobacteriales bacterium]